MAYYNLKRSVVSNSICALIHGKYHRLYSVVSTTQCDMAAARVRKVCRGVEIAAKCKGNNA